MRQNKYYEKNYEKNKDKILLQRKEYYERNKELRTAKMKEYYRENKEALALKKREYYEKNKERLRLKKREYREKNKEIIAAKKSVYNKTIKGKAISANKYHRRKAQMKETDITTDWLVELRDKTLTCPYCNEVYSNDMILHLDHIVPLSKGGIHIKDNVIYCCCKCNLRKGSKAYSEFIRELCSDS